MNFSTRSRGISMPIWRASEMYYTATKYSRKKRKEMCEREEERAAAAAAAAAADARSIVIASTYARYIIVFRVWHIDRCAVWLEIPHRDTLIFVYDHYHRVRG